MKNPFDGKISIWSDVAMNLKEALKNAELLHPISPSTLAMLASCSALKRVARRKILFREKEAVHTLYIVASGIAALCKISEDGERRVVFLCGSGKTLNEVAISNCVASAQCEILQDALLLCIPVDCALRAMEQDFCFAKTMMDSMTLKIRRLYHQMQNTSNSLRGDKRVAAKLWKLARDFGVTQTGETLIDIDLSITLLADMLGFKRETVSRQVKLLRSAGLVCDQNGKFLIPDCDALKNYFQRP